MSTSPNVIIRPAQADDAHSIAYVHVTAWQTTYAYLLPPGFLASLSVEQREEMWRGFFQSDHQNSYLHVAEVDGQVIAFANSGPRRDDYPDYDCELYAIYMLRAYQGHGIGRSLMRAAMRQLADDGQKGMYLWVLERNPAIRFYEAMGGVRFDERRFTIGGKEVTEYAYGYAKLDSV